MCSPIYRCQYHLSLRCIDSQKFEICGLQEGDDTLSLLLVKWISNRKTIFDWISIELGWAEGLKLSKIYVKVFEEGDSGYGYHIECFKLN